MSEAVMETEKLVNMLFNGKVNDMLEDKDKLGDEADDTEWVLVKRRRKKGWNRAQHRNFRQFGDIYEPFYPLVDPGPAPVAVAGPPLPPPAPIPAPAAVAGPPLPPPAPIPAPAAAAGPPLPPQPPPPPQLVLPQADDDDEYTDVDSEDESDDDDATVILDYPGANSPLPHTGDSSDELDDFHSLPTTPAGAQTPVAGPSQGAGGVPFFRPLPLTPEQEATVARALGRKPKKPKPQAGPPKQHQLRSKGAVSPSGQLSTPVRKPRKK